MLSANERKKIYRGGEQTPFARQVVTMAKKTKIKSRRVCKKSAIIFKMILSVIRMEGKCNDRNPIKKKKKKKANQEFQIPDEDQDCVIFYWKSTTSAKELV